MLKYVPALVGVGFVIALLAGIYILFNKYEDSRDQVKTLEIQAATLQTTLEYERKKQEENDTKVAQFKQEIDNITAQRDLFIRKAKEAINNDPKLKTWADTRLPDYVRNSLGGVRKQGSSANPGNR